MFVKKEQSNSEKHSIDCEKRIKLVKEQTPTKVGKPSPNPFLWQSQGQPTGCKKIVNKRNRGTFNKRRGGRGVDSKPTFNLDWWVYDLILPCLWRAILITPRFVLRKLSNWSNFVFMSWEISLFYFKRNDVSVTFWISLGSLLSDWPGLVHRGGGKYVKN